MKTSRLTIIEELGKIRISRGDRKMYVKYICLCGTEGVAQKSAILSGHTSSCGCLLKEARIKLGKSKRSIVNIGERFNSFIILSEVEGFKKRKFLCRCDCGNEKIVSLDNLKSGHSKSCGLCGGYKTLNKTRVRTSKRYEEWRNECFKRDDYTCQISGIRGGKLTVHHLIPFHSIFNDITGEIMDNDLLWDLNNGITITEELHKKFHSLYGNKYFTKDDFDKFKNLHKM